MGSDYFTLYGGYTNSVQLSARVQAWRLDNNGNPDSVKTAILNKVADLIVNTPWSIEQTRPITLERATESHGTITIRTPDIWGQDKCTSIFADAMNSNFSLPELISYKRPDILIPVVRVIAFATEEVPLQIETEPVNIQPKPDATQINADSITAQIESQFEITEASLDSPRVIGNYVADLDPLEPTAADEMPMALEQEDLFLPPQILNAKTAHPSTVSATSAPDSHPIHDLDQIETDASAVLHEQVQPTGPLESAPKRRRQPKLTRQK